MQSLGLFILGLYLGKTNFFKTLDSNRKTILKSLAISTISFILFTILKFVLPETGIQELRLGIAIELIETYLNLALSAILILVFIVIYQKKSDLFSLLIPYGRMSLTNYVLQALVGVPVFYGFGLGLYNYFGATLSLIFGILFLVFQLYFSKYWLKKYKYGPLEWLWRAITYFNFKLPFRKTETILPQH
ncbi:DUF418 domain-containing protein [Flavobacteriaceae bacterium XHP0103]|uniref:DUF418 domain-containing protein n=1 Tax=Marixanthotalea marina TaxID=2844359 RepID=UPI002989DD91|nr:DUF418 domain-containing protein [Marixanthotalea marina]MBU3821133.1 DUF418 domain-containing protein [Marixanthotalea marina]